MNEFVKHRNSLLSEIYKNNEDKFEKLALELFHFQKKYCKVYRDFINCTRRNFDDVNFENIPFLPISSFKNHRVMTGEWKAEIIFKSSGTSDSGRSIHVIRDVQRYLTQSKKYFTESLGVSDSTQLLALLPSYRSQGESSLLCMIDGISEDVDFLGYKDDPISQAEEISSIIESSMDLIIFGVSYSLLDLAEKIQSNAHFRLVDTGGMKGRRKEMTSAEVHKIYRNSWPNAQIISEYGMTELNSQLYSQDAWFKASPSLRMYQKDLNDHFGTLKTSGRGRAYCVDLWNIDSCSFIETDDLVLIKDASNYQILGRLDHSDIRGCNQLYLEE